jgi:hypothetical protein
MRGENTGSRELPPGMLDEIQNLLHQKLQVPNKNFLPQVSEHLTKAVNLAQGNVQYPVAGKWQEQDFQQASAELSDRLCQILNLNFKSLNQDIQTEIQKAIQNALRFLERAALADPPGYLSLDKEGDPFRDDYHEAAKGYDDEGKIIKAIYPVYLVNSEAKVKAIVLTEPLVQPSADSSPPTKMEDQSVSVGTNDDEKQKTILQIKLETKRESLIKNIKGKWANEDNAILTSMSEYFLQIGSFEIIEKLENEFSKNQNMSLLEFQQTLKIEGLIVE